MSSFTINLIYFYFYFLPSLDTYTILMDFAFYTFVYNSYYIHKKIHFKFIHHLINTCVSYINSDTEKLREIYANNGDFYWIKFFFRFLIRLKSFSSLTKIVCVCVCKCMKICLLHKLKRNLHTLALWRQKAHCHWWSVEEHFSQTKN